MDADFIDEKLKAEKEPSEKLDSLRLKVLEKLDQIDQCPNHNHETEPVRNQPKDQSPPFFTMTKIIATAAVLVLVIGAGFIINSLLHHNEYYIPLERAHVSASDNTTPYKNIQNLSSALMHVTNDMHYQLNQKIQDYQLIGGQNTEIMEAGMTHFMYADRKEQHFVSVFVLPASDLLLDEELQDHQVKVNDITFYDHNCRGCRLVFHQVGDLMIITATTEKTVDLLDFIPGQRAI